MFSKIHIILAMQVVISSTSPRPASGVDRKPGEREYTLNKSASTQAGRLSRAGRRIKQKAHHQASLGNAGGYKKPRGIFTFGYNATSVRSCSVKELNPDVACPVGRGAHSRQADSATRGGVSADPLVLIELGSLVYILGCAKESPFLAKGPSNGSVDQGEQPYIGDVWQPKSASRHVWGRTVPVTSHDWR